MNYKLILPDNYVKRPLPGRNAWLADLRNPPDNVKQGTRKLRKEVNGVFYDCCLGRLSCIQGRLIGSEDNWADKNKTIYGVLSTDNPAFAALSFNGETPRNVYIELGDYQSGNLGKYNVLSALNDRGLTFNQIADIIEAVWDNA